MDQILTNVCQTARGKLTIHVSVSEMTVVVAGTYIGCRLVIVLPLDMQCMSDGTWKAVEKVFNNTCIGK